MLERVNTPVPRPYNFPYSQTKIHSRRSSTGVNLLQDQGNYLAVELGCWRGFKEELRERGLGETKRRGNRTPKRGWIANLSVVSTLTTSSVHSVRLGTGLAPLLFLPILGLLAPLPALGICRPVAEGLAGIFFLGP